MTRLWTVLCAVFVVVVAACTQIPPTAQDVQAKRIESAPGKAVIYLVRTKPDVSDMPAPVMLDDQLIGSTYAGTYYRLEVSPGRHRIRGYSQDAGSINVDVQGDRIYFVQHTVIASRLTPDPMSVFRLIPEGEGRAVVARGQLAG